MLKKYTFLFCLSLTACVACHAGADSLKNYISIIKQHIYGDYKGMFRPAKV